MIEDPLKVDKCNIPDNEKTSETSSSDKLKGMLKPKNLFLKIALVILIVIVGTWVGSVFVGINLLKFSYYYIFLLAVAALVLFSIYNGNIDPEVIGTTIQILIIVTFLTVIIKVCWPEANLKNFSKFSEKRSIEYASQEEGAMILNKYQSTFMSLDENSISPKIYIKSKSDFTFGVNTDSCSSDSIITYIFNQYGRSIGEYPKWDTKKFPKIQSGWYLRIKSLRFMRKIKIYVK